jgi:hypothetical protein
MKTSQETQTEWIPQLNLPSVDTAPLPQGGQGVQGAEEIVVHLTAAKIPSLHSSCGSIGR